MSNYVVELIEGINFNLFFIFEHTALIIVIMIAILLFILITELILSSFYLFL
jgi:hypothetical protein